MMTKLPFSAHFLDVLYKSVEKHGKDKLLTLGHLLGIVKLAIKLTRKHNGKVDAWMQSSTLPKVDNG